MTEYETIICHPDIIEDIQAAIQTLDKKDEIRVVPNPIVPDRDTIYIVRDGFGPILK